MLEKYLTYDKFVPPVEYRNGVNPQDPRVLKHMAEIEKVPDQIQRLIADKGGYIVFFNGPLTEQPEMQHCKGQQTPNWPDGTTWDAMIGCYNDKIVFLGIDGNYIGYRDISIHEYGNISLHEYGHSIDEVIGQMIFGMPLSLTPIAEKILKENKKLREFYKGIPEEFIAFAVNEFYQSPYKRDSLIDYSLDSARLIKGIEEWAVQYELSEDKPDFSLAKNVKKSSNPIEVIFAGRIIKRRLKNFIIEEVREIDWVVEE